MKICVIGGGGGIDSKLPSMSSESEFVGKVP